MTAGRCKDCRHLDSDGPQVARGTAGVPRQALCRVDPRRPALPLRWAWDSCERFAERQAVADDQTMAGPEEETP